MFSRQDKAAMKKLREETTPSFIPAPQPMSDKVRTVWTQNYTPFIMGGSVHHSIVTEVEILEERVIKGIPFFTWLTPKGKMRLSEGVSGAIVADSFEDLLEAIQGMSDTEVMNQLKEGVSVFINPRRLSKEEFFKLYER